MQGLRNEVLAEVKELKVMRNRLQLETALEAVRPAGGGADPRSARWPSQQLECLDLAEVERLIGLQRTALAAAAQPRS